MRDQIKITDQLTPEQLEVIKDFWEKLTNKDTLEYLTQVIPYFLEDPNNEDDSESLKFLEDLVTEKNMPSLQLSKIVPTVEDLIETAKVTADSRESIFKFLEITENLGNVAANLDPESANIMLPILDLLTSSHKLSETLQKTPPNYADYLKKQEIVEQKANNKFGVDPKIFSDSETSKKEREEILANIVDQILNNPANGRPLTSEEYVVFRFYGLGDSTFQELDNRYLSGQSHKSSGLDFDLHDAQMFLIGALMNRDQAWCQESPFVQKIFEMRSGITEEKYKLSCLSVDDSPLRINIDDLKEKDLIEDKIYFYLSDEHKLSYVMKNPNSKSQNDQVIRGTIEDPYCDELNTEFLQKNKSSILQAIAKKKHIDLNFKNFVKGTSNLGLEFLCYFFAKDYNEKVFESIGEAHRNPLQKILSKLPAIKELPLKFRFNKNFNHDFLVAKTLANIEKWQDKDQDTSNKVNKLQPFASVEAVFKALSFSNIKDDPIPGTNKDGKKLNYTMKELIDQKGIRGFALIPCDPSEDQEIKIVMSDDKNFLKSILRGGYKYQDYFEMHKSELLQKLNTVVADFKQEIVNKGYPEQVSLNIGGLGTGGAIAQHLLNEIVTYKAAEQYKDEPELLSKNLQTSALIQHQFKNSQKDSTKYAEEKVKFCKERFNRVKSSMDQNIASDNNVLKTISKFNLSTVNAAGVTKAKRQQFVHALSVLKEPIATNSVELNATLLMTAGDPIQQLGECHLLERIPQEFTPVKSNEIPNPQTQKLANIQGIKFNTKYEKGFQSKLWSIAKMIMLAPLKMTVSKFVGEDSKILSLLGESPDSIISGLQQVSEKMGEAYREGKLAHKAMFFDGDNLPNNDYRIFTNKKGVDHFVYLNSELEQKIPLFNSKLFLQAAKKFKQLFKKSSTSKIDRLTKEDSKENAEAINPLVFNGSLQQQVIEYIPHEFLKILAKNLEPLQKVSQKSARLDAQNQSQLFMGFMAPERNNSALSTSFSKEILEKINHQSRSLDLNNLANEYNRPVILLGTAVADQKNLFVPKNLDPPLGEPIFLTPKQDRTGYTLLVFKDEGANEQNLELKSKLTELIKQVQFHNAKTKLTNTYQFPARGG